MLSSWLADEQDSPAPVDNPTSWETGCVHRQYEELGSVNLLENLSPPFYTEGSRVGRPRGWIQFCLLF